MLPSLTWRRSRPAPGVWIGLYLSMAVAAFAAGATVSGLAMLAGTQPEYGLTVTVLGLALLCFVGWVHVKDGELSYVNVGGTRRIRAVDVIDVDIADRRINGIRHWYPVLVLDDETAIELTALASMSKRRTNRARVAIVVAFRRGAASDTTDAVPDTVDAGPVASLTVPAGVSAG